MDIKEFIDEHQIRWFGEGHDLIEATLRRAGALVFKAQKVKQHDIWQIVAHLPGGGGLPVRLHFAARMRSALLGEKIIDKKGEVHVAGSGERVTLSFISPIGDFGGICYNKTSRGRIVSCREEYFCVER